MFLAVATDRMAPHTGIPLMSGLPRRSPAGVRHAIRLGRGRTLCGLEPVLVWADRAWPDGAPTSELCADCDAVAARRTGAVIRLPARLLPLEGTT